MQKQQKTSRAFLFLLFIAGTLQSTPLEAESLDDILVFVNPSNSIRKLSVAEVRQIFLKEKTKWSTGNNILCIHPPQNVGLRNQFRSQVLDMTQEEEDTYWQDKKIRDNLSPPVSLGNTYRAVFSLREGISYGYRKDVPRSAVKIVLVIPAH
ncbi:MAG: hypothetical protein JXR76_11945 [Deltaproteobacteria bacterium]|nr:hypothetical protein [Deltaproteobacteria bacterium]